MPSADKPQRPLTLAYSSTLVHYPSIVPGPLDPELPPREESPMSAISEGRTEDERKESFPDSPGKILELSLLWTQAVPSFRSLSESEKSRLLNANWRLLFLLSLAEWSHSLLIGVTDYEPAVKAALSSVRSLELDRTEFSCLKAIALFLNESSTNDLFEIHLEQSLTVLNQHTVRNHPTSSRCGRLLLALGDLRSVPPALVDQILSSEGGHLKILSRFLIVANCLPNTQIYIKINKILNKENFLDLVHHSIELIILYRLCDPSVVSCSSKNDFHI
ncbi:Zinc finger, C4 type (two domains) [Parelaphostrongylus tenuis]|uniref:Zinc finger, C4 type (Two domains) n=1 Tax=Parelaphostrongylus tenuis TaxID=148309 RepID=A0AAD5LYI8_PARTN|nr:Zinc finger, C4 type (two domains) [Parelaphostrongylus tenuis]